MRLFESIGILFCAVLAGLAGCGIHAEQAGGTGPPADIVFVGDHIVTMDPDQPTVEAVAVRDETIAAAGSRDDVLALRGATTRVVELGDRALLPGFIDAHGHFLAVGRALDSLSLHPPPVGDGVLEERAGGLVAAGLFRATTDDTEGLARRAIGEYVRYGTTTVQDGSTGWETAAALRAAAEREPFAADVAVFPRFQTLVDAERVVHEPDYRGGFRIAGVKFGLDGSPQGRTAWVTEPYAEGPPGAPSNYRAYGTLDPDAYKAGAAHLIRLGVPIIVHANGDAAIDLMLDGVDEAVEDMETLPDHRAVIIHAQLMRADQLDRAAALRVVPSFFSAHAFFWGDWHRQSFGEARGNNVSPVRWAIERGVPFTVHNDAPIVPPDILRLVSITVNRTTRSGHVLGPHQRATVQEALHAVTLGAAYPAAPLQPNPSAGRSGRLP